MFLPYQIGHHRFWMKLIGYQRLPHFGHMTIIIAQFYQLSYYSTTLPCFLKINIGHIQMQTANSKQYKPCHIYKYFFAHYAILL